MIPHLGDNQQYISFPPCPYGLTGNKANKLVPVATHGDGCTVRSEHMLDCRNLELCDAYPGVGPSTVRDLESRLGCDMEIGGGDNGMEKYFVWTIRAKAGLGRIDLTQIGKDNKRY